METKEERESEMDRGERAKGESERERDSSTVTRREGERVNYIQNM